MFQESHGNSPPYSWTLPVPLHTRMFRDSQALCQMLRGFVRWRVRANAVLLVVACGSVHACATASYEAASEPATWAGCYAVELGPWSPARQASNLPYLTPPEMIQLDTAMVQVSRSGDLKHRLWPFPDVRTVPLDSIAYWEPLSGDSVGLSWSTGLSGVFIRAARQPYGFSGMTQRWIDVPPPPGQSWPRADVRAERVACSAPR